MDKKINHSPSPALHKHVLASTKPIKGLEQPCSHGLPLLPRDTHVAWNSDGPQRANLKAPKAPKAIKAPKGPNNKATPLLCSTAGGRGLMDVALYRILGWFGLEETLKLIPFPTGRETFCYPRLLQALSTLADL